MSLFQGIFRNIGSSLVFEQPTEDFTRKPFFELKLNINKNLDAGLRIYRVGDYQLHVTKTGVRLLLQSKNTSNRAPEIIKEISTTEFFKGVDSYSLPSEVYIRTIILQD